MNRLQFIILVSKTLIHHLQLRKQDKDQKYIWVKFYTSALDEKIQSKEQWLDHMKSVAASCGCKFVNYLLTDYDTKIMYFFTNPSYVQNMTAMEQLQEASYAR